jgi:hypothetical protein
VAAIEKTEMEIADFYVRCLGAVKQETSLPIGKGEQKMTHRRGAEDAEEEFIARKYSDLCELCVPLR